jgi:hypothetical protein
MNAKGIWIVVRLLAVFAGGFAAGILYRDHVAPSSHEGRHARGHDAAHFLDYFRSRLDLTDEQAAEVNGVLGRLHREMEGMGTDFHDRFIALRKDAWTDIRATLSERQRLEFEELVEEMEKEHSHHTGDSGK